MLAIGLLILLFLVLVGIYVYEAHYKKDNSPDPEVQGSVELNEGNLTEEETSDEVVLDDLKNVKGIGPAREKKLLDQFGTKKAVVNARDEELEDIIPGHIVERLKRKVS